MKQCEGRFPPLDPLAAAAVQQLIVQSLNVPKAVRERAKLTFGR